MDRVSYKLHYVKTVLRKGGGGGDDVASNNNGDDYELQQ